MRIIIKQIKRLCFFSCSKLNLFSSKKPKFISFVSRLHKINFANLRTKFLLPNPFGPPIIIVFIFFVHIIAKMSFVTFYLRNNFYL